MMLRLLVVLLMSSFLNQAARAEGRPRFGGTIHGTLRGQPHANPAHGSAPADIAIMSLVSDTLYRVTDEQLAQPALANSTPVLSNNGLTATIAVKPQIYFHDGSLLTPGDVAASLERQRNGPNGWLLAFIKDVRANDSEVIISLRRRAPELTQILSHPLSGIIKSSSNTLVGTGPFIWKTRAHRHITLRSNENHYQGRPFIRGMKLHWFATTRAEATQYEIGKLHYSLSGSTAFSGRTPKYPTQASDASKSFTYLASCHDSPWSKSARLRRALSLAIDRRAFKTVGIPGQVYPTDFPKAHLDKASYAPANILRAQRIVKRSGFYRDLVTTPVIIMTNKSRATSQTAAERIYNALLKLKMRAQIVAVDTQTYITKQRTGGCGLRIDTIGGMTNSIAAYLMIFNQAQRSATLQRYARQAPTLPVLARRFKDEFPVIPLYYRQATVHHRKDLRLAADDTSWSATLANSYFLLR